ncbi:uncharacterized protein I303_102417 [Kwoniella dejecticola CBS 10117]|uniref:Uncharacterized protein n=1 Tax=Kwoniella dejecticola CBS 10117 TaxID=1296121 RepID=A0A1A6A8P3_9TREE|nr:uncharacterized protein I303_02432 [Kwoniella dejecticola CBS 10117]OBR86425.1 hypothetical protein I303_02432 [Kwoniella dejecticola CBS 10117]
MDTNSTLAAYSKISEDIASLAAHYQNPEETVNVTRYLKALRDQITARLNNPASGSLSGINTNQPGVGSESGQFVNTQRIDRIGRDCQEWFSDPNSPSNRSISINGSEITVMRSGAPGH